MTKFVPDRRIDHELWLELKSITKTARLLVETHHDVHSDCRLAFLDRCDSALQKLDEANELR